MIRTANPTPGEPRATAQIARREGVYVEHLVAAVLADRRFGRGSVSSVVDMVRGHKKARQEGGLVWCGTLSATAKKTGPGSGVRGNKKGPPIGGPVLLVAGVGFEPTTFRL